MLSFDYWGGFTAANERTVRTRLSQIRKHHEVRCSEKFIISHFHKTPPNGRFGGTALAPHGYRLMTFTPTRAAGLARLSSFAPKAGKAYESSRNFDDPAGADGMRGNVSQLSLWLHAGLLSEAEVIETILSQHSPAAAEKFIAEVFWRIYFKGYLEQRPSVWHSCCDGRAHAFAKLDANAGLRSAYAQATQGRTGIAAFDHWARELVQTGYLHNHARMWFASIWIFTLKLDWQLGADFFLRHLIDGDAASNTLSWRWVGGLHTKGKTYLARPGNIARYTANHPGGPMEAEGLATDALALEEAQDHGRQQIAFPPVSQPGQPYALLLHDEAAHHAPLALETPPSLIIGAARPDARSGGELGAHARDFALEAVKNGVAEASEAFSCPSVIWQAGSSLGEMLDGSGLTDVLTAYTATGWTKDALAADLTPLEEQGRLHIKIQDLDRATWPAAKAGFFGVKKQVNDILEELGITGRG